jgi:hypothetical protein
VLCLRSPGRRDALRTPVARCSMGKNKGGGSAKADRRAAKTEQSRSRAKGKKHNKLDAKEVASFARALHLEGFELKEVARDGNCFFRSLCDQLDNHEHDHEKYRQTVMDYVEAHEDEFSPFMSFGESEEEEDKDFEAYVARMRTDSEWAGQVELIAAAQALRVHIVVHQLEHPSYRIECRSEHSGKARSSKKPPRDVHLSYHDGEHYNSVHPLGGGSKATTTSSSSSSSSNVSTGAECSSGDGDGSDHDGNNDGNEGDDEVDAHLAARATATRLDDAGADAAAEEAPKIRASTAKGARRKEREEAKARRKMERHRQAVLASGGAAATVTDEDADTEDGGTDRSKLITL